MHVDKVMTKKVISFKESDTLDKVIKKFAKSSISGAPVLDNKKKVVGIIT